MSAFFETKHIDNYMFEKIFDINLLKKAKFPDIDIFYGEDQILTKIILEKANSLLILNKAFYEYSGPAGSSPKKWTFERMQKTGYIVQYVENRNYNKNNKTCIRNKNIVWIYLSSLFVTLGNCSISKKQCDELRNCEAFHVIANYVYGGEGRPKVKFTSAKDKIKLFLFKLFSKKHYASAKLIARVFARLKRN